MMTKAPKAKGTRGSGRPKKAGYQKTHLKMSLLYPTRGLIRISLIEPDALGKCRKTNLKRWSPPDGRSAGTGGCDGLCVEARPAIIWRGSFDLDGRSFKGISLILGEKLISGDGVKSV